MDSSRAAAFKAKLREGTSTASRRKSRGAERKSNRDNEVNKRRLLSNSNMSPVVENHGSEDQEEGTQTQQPRQKKGSNRRTAKVDNVLDRLKIWREEKKHRLEQEKLNKKAKPMFKVGAMFRDAEAGLFKNETIEIKGKETKATTKKAEPPAKQEPVIKKNTRGNFPTDVVKKNKPAAVASVVKNDKEPAKLEAKKTVKNQLPKIKESLPSARTSKLQRSTKSTADLASKLTVAAAAKRNGLNASPKKFLRATRATTLQKKELLDNKKGSKSLKGTLKSTGKLSNKKTDDLDGTNTSSQSQNDIAPFEPSEVPQILKDFDFSAMSGNSSDEKSFGTVESISLDCKIKSSDNLETGILADLPLKSNRKSMRKSTRLASLEMNNVNDTAVQSSSQNDSFDNLITFTPGLSKRSVRKSTRLSTSVARQLRGVCDADIPSLDLDTRSVTPKLSRRKSTRKSMALSLASTQEFEGLQISCQDTPMKDSDPKRNSIRKSNAPIPDFGIEGNFDDGTASNFLPSNSKNGANNPSSPLKEMEVTEIPVVSTPPSAVNKSRRKSTRKSLALAPVPAMDVLESDSVNALNFGSDSSTEEEMELDANQHMTSDLDTQVSLNEVTSTPKSYRGQSMGSAHQKRQSMLMNSLTVSSIEDISSSPEKAIAKTPKLRLRRSRNSARRSSVTRRRSRRSVVTPARTPRSQVADDSKNGNDSNISGAATPNSVRNIENIPRSATSRRNARKSSVISVSDEGTAVGRDLELALAYKVEKPVLSAKASRILNELVIEKVDGEKSFFEVSFDESMRENQRNSFSYPESKSVNLSSSSKIQSTSTSPFTPRKSNEVTSSSSSNSLVTPKTTSHARHSMAPLSGFKEPGLPLSALRKSGSRRKTCSTPSKTPEQMINILKKSPMVEMTRRRSRHVSSPAPVKGQYFRDLINNEMDRLTNLSNKWNDVVTREAGIEEDVLGQIRCTVGKALLLMDQRFKQFSGLVDNYVYDLGEKKTTPTDLQGFWDMIYFQVEDVDSQFKELEEMRQSNWQIKKASPTVAAGPKKKIASKAKAKPKGVKSNFAAFRAELQKKKAAQLLEAAPTTDQDNVAMVVS